MERDGGLVPADKRYAGRLAAVLTRDDENVSFVQDIRKNPELLSALTSEDGEARYLLVGITGQTGAPSSIRQVTAVRAVAADLAPDGLEVAVTGPTATITDLATETEHSVVRITIVSIGLIALLLWLIYRSFAVMALVLTIVGHRPRTGARAHRAVRLKSGSSRCRRSAARSSPPSCSAPAPTTRSSW